MAYIIEIRKNSTGEVRLIKQGMKWHENSEFFWTEGNYACDCNRHNEFVGGEGGLEFPCGSVEYTVIRAIFEDGSEIKLDD